MATGAASRPPLIWSVPVNTKLLKGLSLFAATVLALVAAELTVRWVLPPPTMWRVQPAELVRDDGPRHSVTIPRHPAQGGLFVVRGVHKRLRPNVDAVVARHSLSGLRVRISTNELGLRHGPLTPDSNRRVLFLGDSITLADYLPDDETFVRRVERLTHEGGRDLECVNAGVGAVGTDSEVALYFELESAVEPEIVVLNMYLNDFAESLSWKNPLPQWLRRSVLVEYGSSLFLQTAALVQDDDPAARQLPRWREDLVAARVAQKGHRAALEPTALAAFRDWGGAWSPHAWELVRRPLQTLARHCRDQDRRLLVVLHPVRAQVESPELDATPQHHFARLTASLGVHSLDLLPGLRAAYNAGSDPLFYDQCHHTPAGAAVVAVPISHELLAMESDAS